MLQGNIGIEPPQLLSTRVSTSWFPPIRCQILPQDLFFSHGGYADDSRVTRLTRMSCSGYCNDCFPQPATPQVTTRLVRFTYTAARSLYDHNVYVSLAGLASNPSKPWTPPTLSDHALCPHGSCNPNCTSQMESLADVLSRAIECGIDDRSHMNACHSDSFGLQMQ